MCYVFPLKKCLNVILFTGYVKCSNSCDEGNQLIRFNELNIALVFRNCSLSFCQFVKKVEKYEFTGIYDNDDDRY